MIELKRRFRVVVSSTFVALACLGMQPADRGATAGGRDQRESQAERLRNASELAETFLRDAPRAWERLSDAMTFLKASGRSYVYGRPLKSRGRLPDFTEDHMRSSWCAARGKQDEVKWELVEYRRAGAGEKRGERMHRRKEVDVVNGDYAFVLTTVDSSGSRYALDLLEKVSAARAGWQAQFASKLRDFDTFFYASCRPYGLNLGELLRSPHFRLKKVSPVSNELVRAEFDYMPPLPGDARGWKRFERFRDGTAVFRPGKSWTLQEFSAKFYGGEHLFYLELKYGTPLDGIPCVVRVSSWRPTDGGQWGLLCHEYDKWNRDVDSSEFYLSYYGFPEPNFDTQSRRLSTIMYAAIGFMCLICAYLFWRRQTQADSS